MGIGIGSTKIDEVGKDHDRREQHRQDRTRGAQARVAGVVSVDEPGRHAAGQEADRVQRREARRSDVPLEPEPEGPERETVEEEVGDVGVDEAAGHERGVLAPLRQTARPQQVALDELRAR
jgi:hypothetical protein